MKRTLELWLSIVVCLLTVVAAIDAAWAAEVTVSPRQPLTQAIQAAQPGDTLRLSAGVHGGNLTIDRPLTLQGEAGAIIQGDGSGDTLRIQSPNITLAGLTIRGSGGNLTDMNAGIFIEKAATGTVVRDSHIQAPAFGIWVDATDDVIIEDNRVEGDPAIRSQDRGNGIHLYAVSGAQVAGNEVWHTRDGIYIDTSNGNTLEGNFLHDLRYGVHYMYSHHNQVTGNRTRNTRTGYALMQSKYLTVTDNVSERDQNYGILMNFITNSTIAGNRILEVQQGRNPGVAQAAGIEGAEGKALFVYNSVYNTIRDNRFGPAEIGIHLTAGSEDNKITGNAFTGNRTQVKYVANREQQWPGNYWSDYLGWDLDADGRGDVPYEPNDQVDKLLWQYPSAKLLMNSPAVLTLRWVQREFPVLRPAGVQDPNPLMEPPL